MDSIQISNISIRQHKGLFSLNDLHRASGGEKRFQPANWIRNSQTIDLINFLKNEELQSEGRIIQSKQKLGTFVCKELVYAYATWISAKFFLQVIRTFDMVVTARRNPEPPPILPSLPQYAGDPKAEEKYLLLSEVYSALSVQASLAASGLVHRQTQEFLNVVYQRADCLQPKPTPTSLPATPREPATQNPEGIFYTEINNVQVATLFHDGTKYYLAKHLAEAAGLRWAVQLENSKSYFTRLRHFRRGSAACWVSEQSASLWLGRKNPRRVSCPLQLAQTVECLGLLV